MPRVPQVQRAPIPGPRISPVAPAGAFGAPTPDYTGVLRAVSGLVERHRQEADQLTLLDADNQFAQLPTDLHTQATSRQGLDALGATADVQAAWDKGVSDIEGGIRSDRAKDAFRNRVAGRYQTLYGAVERHAANEYQRFASETTKTAINSRFDEALTNFADPAAVETAVNESRAIISDQGRREGWGAETIAEEQRAQASRIQSVVIARMLAKGDDLAATNYYAKVRDQVSGRDALKLEQDLDVSSVRGQSQRNADLILATAATFDAARAEAAKITDPKVREATEERVRREFADRAADDRQQRFQAYQDAGVILERTRDTHTIPPATWNLLSVTERRALQEREEQLRHPRHSSDPDTYWSLMNMAGLSDQSRAAFESVDLNDYRRKGLLDDVDFNRLLSLQRSLRTSTQGAVAGEARRH